MIAKPPLIALTGFMGVGKSSVARHLTSLTGLRRLDLDNFIEAREGRKVAEIIDENGIEAFRRTENRHLTEATAQAVPILSLGGGTYTIESNRSVLKESGYSVIWLEASFEHCWLNISFSKKDRPLGRDKEATRILFEERQKVYCLADWHFIVKPNLSSLDVAKLIAEEVLSC
jgi:shikimate kinase